MTEQKDHVDLQSLGDTGQDNIDAIAPITNGEGATQTVLRRPSENLRERTEIIRQALEDSAYYRDVSAYSIYSTAAITWGGTVADGGDGLVSQGADIVVRPFLRPREDTKGTITSGAGDTEIVYTISSTGYSTEGMNRVTIEHRDTGAASVTVSITDGPVKRILVEFDSGDLTQDTAATKSAVDSAVAGDVDLAGKIEVTDNGTVGNGLTALAETRFEGTAEPEEHLIAFNLLGTLTTTTPLQDGDSIAIWYRHLIEPISGDPDDPKGGIAGGRRESTLGRAGNPSLIPLGSLFVTSENPERIPGALPICTVSNTDLIFIDGTRITKGQSVLLGTSDPTSQLIPEILDTPDSISAGTLFEVLTQLLSLDNNRPRLDATDVFTAKQQIDIDDATLPILTTSKTTADDAGPNNNYKLIFEFPLSTASENRKVRFYTSDWAGGGTWGWAISVNAAFNPVTGLWSADIAGASKQAHILYSTVESLRWERRVNTSVPWSDFDSNDTQFRAGILDLGRFNISTIGEALVARLTTKYVDLGTSKYTLLWTLGDNQTIKTRIYVKPSSADGEATLFMTRNARYTASDTWTFDDVGASAFGIRLDGSSTSCWSHYASDDDPWDDDYAVVSADNTTANWHNLFTTYIDNTDVVPTGFGGSIAIMGHLNLDGASNAPSILTANPLKNKLYKENIPKAWGYCVTDGLGGFTTSQVFGCSLSYDGFKVRVTFTQAMTGTNYAIMTSCEPNGSFQYTLFTNTRATGSFDINAIDNAQALVNLSTTGSIGISFVVFGRQ